MLLSQNRAAQYVRMSTDMQRYSIENQIAAIALYAVEHGLEIVRSYEDAAKSGLRIDKRTGLKQLLSDVVAGRANFTKILVYDVSRWGRFQDNDESAHYEFICREAGVNVEYCAEEFSNDGSVAATLLKNLKRAMAGEFSRELSTKVFVGKCRIITAGFRVGSVAGLGLRRCLLDQNGNRKTELSFGEHKSINTDRIILVPGPVEEIKTLEYIYRLFLDEKCSINAIARTLNSKGLLSDRGRKWRAPAVRNLLSNEKYVGNNVFNRTSRRLGTKNKINPPREWVRATGAFEPVIAVRRFNEAQRLLADNYSSYTDADMLNGLSAIWCVSGCLNKKVIDASNDVPSAATYRRRYGSLAEALRRVGYTLASRHVINERLRAAVIDEMQREITKRGGIVRMFPRATHVRINEELTVAVSIGRTRPSRPASRCRFQHRTRRKEDVTVVIRVSNEGNTVRDYLVIPSMFLLWGQLPRLSGRAYERFSLPTLTPFFDLCGRQTSEILN